VTEIPPLPPEAERLCRTLQAAVATLDGRGRIRSVCGGFAALAGRPADELIGRRWHALCRPAGPDASPLKAVFETAARDGRVDGHINRLVRPDGEARFVEWRFGRMASPGPAGALLAVGHDVTRRETTERRLREERAELLARNRELSCLYGISQLVSKSELGFAEILDSIARFIPGAFHRPDLAAARIRLDQRRFASPDFPEAPAGRLSERIVLHGEMRGRVEVVYRAVDGRPPEFHREERDLLRTVARQLALVLERWDAEAKRAELEEQLRHADRLAKVGQLSAGIAHELNTPLGGILGFAQLAAKTPGLPPAAAADLDRIVHSCLYAREIIRKLMLFSRQMPVQRREVDLNAVVEEGLSFLGHLYERGGVAVTRDLGETPARITADPGQLQQVLVNLIANAVQAMPEGGVLTVRTRMAHGKVWLTVRDTGIGMDPATEARAFEPFFTTKPVEQGTGLGLSVVHGIVTAHGADIRIRTRPGEGTAVRIGFRPSEGGAEFP
jgi:PAS domain S-box-containing protein